MRMLTGLVVLLAGMVVPCFAGAVEIPLGSGLSARFDLPSERWEVSAEAPEFLIDQQVHHLRHEAREKGAQVSDDQLQGLARRRLAANEQLVYNRNTQAVLLIDVSPLREEEEVPGDRAVKLSARYAGESLSSEEGVAEVDFRVRPVRMEGVGSVYRLEADYLLHGKPVRFIGQVGFAEGAWFYLYYTDHLADPLDYGEMESLLESFRFQGAAPK